MSFDRVLGQEFAVGTLRRALQGGRLHHAYRFEGPDGVGKEMAAMALAQAHVCERPVEGEGCGRCGDCRRAQTISAEAPHVPQHPDVIVLEQGLYNEIGIEEKQGISVKQIRQVLLARLHVPPHAGRGRVVIIRNAEEMNQQSANALLKTLEEPPARTHFILLTSKGRMLLDTIRSRALPVRFAPLRDEVMRKILAARGVPASTVEQVLELAGGSVSAALAFADAEETEARAAFVEGVRRAILAPDASEALALVQARDKEKDALKDRLAVLAATFAREARQQELAGIAARQEPDWVRAVLGALRELERNVAPALVLETMLLRMRQAA
ncbi:MAG: DNA polymerase III subunit delta' [Polyangiaceae bacterium]|jgi:DNA polymerase-3 subunit delta'|nr:DNA polymerase III subunit delta' [Polyangiaceae bacterium]